MKSEKGQAIVFLALSFIVFLGFVSLAIDGGMLYSDRRHTQNSSDASSLAGGGASALVLANNAEDHPEITYPDWDCNSAWMNYAEAMGQHVAMVRGVSNGFIIDQTLTQPIASTNNTYVSTQCYDTWNGSYYDRYLEVTVNISDTTDSSLAHLLFPAPLRNIVDATTRVKPKTPWGNGFAIIALSYECSGFDGGVIFKGNANLDVVGGGIFSNACFDANGTGLSVEVYDEEGNPIESVCTGEGCYDPYGFPQIIPTPIEGTNPYGIPPESLYIPPPTCFGETQPEVKVTNKKVVTISPGTYEAITVNGGELYLDPGLYCIVGKKGISITGGQVWGPNNYSPEAASSYPDGFPTGVSFYMTKGPITLTGTPHVRFTAAMKGSCVPTEEEPHPCPGIFDNDNDLLAVLFYLAQDNTSNIVLVGDSTSDFTGLIYAPVGSVDIGGNSNGLTTFNIQIIADTVIAHGHPDMFINYDKEKTRWTSVKIELSE